MEAIRRNRRRSERHGGEEGRNIHRMSVTFSSRRAIAIEARPFDGIDGGREDSGEEGRDINASARTGAEC